MRLVIECRGRMVHIREVIEVLSKDSRVCCHSLQGNMDVVPQIRPVQLSFRFIIQRHVF
jgi:hypothetical protein